MHQRIPVSLLAAALLAAAPLRAQAVRGRLADGAGAPIPNVLVALLDESGRQRAAAITDAAGRFSIRAPGAGAYTLRAERVGYRTTASAPFRLGVGQTVEQALVAGSAQVGLRELVAEGAARRCAVRPGVNVQTATLWEEVRKALNATAYGQEQRLFNYTVVQYERDLDTQGRVKKEETRTTAALAVHPFASPPPAELSARGYMQKTEAGTFYYGPDVRTLLSDEFLDDHCMRIADDRRAAGDSLIGLAFEPVRGRRVPEVRGTLWLDRATARLRRVEYGYVNLPSRLDSPHLGGSIEFEPLPSGPWIVRSWVIRMPVVQVVQGSRAGIDDQVHRDYENETLAGIREDGGVVQATSTREGAAVLASGPGATLQGTVWDSTRAAPLAGARVYVSGTQHTATTDELGRFRMDGLSAGAYTVGFTHPALGAVAAAAAPAQVTVEAGKLATVQLAVPGWSGVAEALCPDSTRGAGRGAVLGSVAPAGGGMGAATVSATWTPAGRGAGAVRAVADESGFYVLCGVPRGRPVRLAASSGPLTGPAAQVRVDGPVARQDLALNDVSGRVSVATSDSAQGVRLAAVNATSRALPRDFVRRRGTGRGYYLTRDEIVRKNAIRTSDIFRGIPGVHLVSGPGGDRLEMSGSVAQRYNTEIMPARDQEKKDQLTRQMNGGVMPHGSKDDPAVHGTGITREMDAAGGNISGHSGAGVCQVKY